MAEDQQPNTDPQVDAQARQQLGDAKVRIRVNDADLTTNYANAFRTNTSAEEVIVDFGMNVAVRDAQSQGQQPSGEIQFNVDRRIVLNYYTTKRLAILLSQIVRQYEDRFGELKLNANERRAS